MVVGVLMFRFHCHHLIRRERHPPFLGCPSSAGLDPTSSPTEGIRISNVDRVDLRSPDSEIFLFLTRFEWGESRHREQARQLPKKLSYHEVVDLGPVRGEC